jgi:hypothetical protein
MLPTIRQRKSVQHLYWTPVDDDPSHGSILSSYHLFSSYHLARTWSLRNTYKASLDVVESFRTFKNATRLTMEEGSGWSDEVCEATKIETHSCMGSAVRVGNDFMVSKQKSVPSLHENGMFGLVQIHSYPATPGCTRGWTSDIWIITRKSKTGRPMETYCDWRTALSKADLSCSYENPIIR